MRKTKSTVLVLLLVYGVSGVITSSAAAQLFHFSKVGTLKSKQSTAAIWNLAGGTVQCNKAMSHDHTSALLVLTVEEIIEYTGCTAFSFINADVGPEVRVLSADGSRFIKTPLVITPLGAGCTVTIQSQTLKVVNFTNESGKLLEEDSLHTVKATSTGGLCGGETTNGTFSGRFELELEGGTVSWS